MELIACPLFKCMNDPYQWPFICNIHMRMEWENTGQEWAFLDSIFQIIHKIIRKRKHFTRKKTHKWTIFFSKGFTKEQNRDNADYHYVTVNIMTCSIWHSFIVQCKNRFWFYISFVPILSGFRMHTIPSTIIQQS